jgi:mannose-6-phosphate isomerase-like protein (cupin superfamily)
MRRWLIRRNGDLIAESGHCGLRRRLLLKEDRHRLTTEVYYIIAGEGVLELDGEVVAVGPGDSVIIPPGVVHSARSDGGLEVLIIMVPPEAESGDLEEVDTHGQIPC